MIGAFSGVRFDLQDWVAAHPTATQIRACVENVCRQLDRPYLMGMELVGPVSVKVSLTIADKHNVVLFDARATVPLHKFQPNGPNCDPTVWQAAVAPTDAGRLEIRPATSQSP